MPNPFTLPARGPGDFRPLCPWDEPSHAHLYVAVDHTAESFAEFTKQMEAMPSSVRRGQTVLATGPEGSGKTALLHRCGSWLRERGAAASEPTTVLDFTGQRLGGSDSEGQLRHIVGRLVDKVSLLRLLEDSAQRALVERRAEPYQALPFLGDALEQAATPHRLVVVVPPIELAEEIERYATLAHPYVTLLTETTKLDVTERGKALAQRGDFVTCLDLGALCIDDGWRFVEARLSSVGPTGLPELTKDTVDRYMSSAIALGGTTIAQLQQACSSVFDEAVRQARQRIEYVHFAEYWMARGMGSQ